MLLILVFDQLKPNSKRVLIPFDRCKNHR